MDYPDFIRNGITRIAERIEAKGLDVAELAREIDVEPATLERFIGGDGDALLIGACAHLLDEIGLDFRVFDKAT